MENHRERWIRLKITAFLKQDSQRQSYDAQRNWIHPDNRKRWFEKNYDYDQIARHLADENKGYTSHEIAAYMKQMVLEARTEALLTDQ